MGNEQSGNPVRNMDKRTARREYRDDFVAAIKRYRHALKIEYNSVDYHSNSVENSTRHDKEWFDGHIRVFVRKRPIFKHELDAFEFDVATCHGGNSVVIHDARMHNDMKKQIMHHHTFQFDQVSNRNSSHTFYWRI